MMRDGASAQSGLSRGFRVPNFSGLVPDGRTLLFYEFATGRPTLLAGCGAGWSEERCLEFVRAVEACAHERGMNAVTFSGPVASGAGAPSDLTVTVVDEGGALRERLFGSVVSHAEGALVITDPNLRVIEGAAVEEDALKSGALTAGMNALVQDALSELEAETASTPAVAPVLLIPRVLPLELCQGLIDGFESWRPQPSPMPSEDGLAVDAERKARDDAFIEDERMDKEITFSIAHRVLPEISKAFAYAATRLERLKLVRYRATESGHFGAHRDNTAPATAHRRFALTLNLNAGAYEGGALAFPEYGPACVYDVPAGSALVFACAHAHWVQPVTRGERYAIVSFAFGEEARSAAQA